MIRRFVPFVVRSLQTVSGCSTTLLTMFCGQTILNGRETPVPAKLLGTFVSRDRKLRLQTRHEGSEPYASELFVRHADAFEVMCTICPFPLSAQSSRESLW